MTFKCAVCNGKLLFLSSVEVLACNSCGKRFLVKDLKQKSCCQDEIDYLTAAEKVADRQSRGVCIYCGSIYANLISSPLCARCGKQKPGLIERLFDEIVSEIK